MNRYYLYYIFSMEKLLFHETILNNIPKYDKCDQFNFGEIEISDIPKLELLIDKMDFRSELDGNDAIKRLEMGNKCYCTFFESEMIGYQWFAISSYWIPYCNATIYLKPNECYSFNSYIHKRFRGNKLHSKLKAFAFSHLRKEGYERCIGNVFDWNIASQKSNQRSGAKFIGKLIYGHIFLIKYQLITNKSIDLVLHDSCISTLVRLFAKLVNYSAVHPKSVKNWL